MSKEYVLRWAGRGVYRWKISSVPVEINGVPVEKVVYQWKKVVYQWKALIAKDI